MKTFKNSAAQGDILLMKTDSIPKNAKKVVTKKTKYIVAHSETGHHHTVEAKGADLYVTNDPMISYLDVKVPSIALKHERPFDTHEMLSIPKGKYIIRRQREHTPQGWRMIMD